MADYSSEDYEGNCIFCKIGKKEISPMGDGLIYEDEEYMAFLSPFPNTEGFSVVMPKRHHDSDVLGLNDYVLAEFVIVAKKVAKLLSDAFDDVGRVGLIMEGTGINHAHIKLFPMHGTAHMKQKIWKQYSSDNKIFFKEYLGYISSNDSNKADFVALKKLADKIKKN